jgi:Nucleotidyl transferase AbiEii toxin, Type IV TA system
MLHFETVLPSTVRVLNELMEIEELKSFNLVGGTALALQLGHRKSDDIDLFLDKDFEKRPVINILKEKFADRFILTSKETNSLGVFCYIDDIKIDICKHPFPLIEKILVEENIRMWSIKEIAAAKVHAISNRAKKKDFWDIDIILDKVSIEEITSLYKKKYDPLLAITVSQILIYFDDANDSETPECYLGKTWEQIQTSIKRKINYQFK